MYHILHSCKQCKSAKICKVLVEGFAPKPLKTRACALWLWGIPGVIPRFSFR